MYVPLLYRFSENFCSLHKGHSITTWTRRVGREPRLDMYHEKLDNRAVGRFENLGVLVVMK